jgi:hypothetical protein
MIKNVVLLAGSILVAVLKVWQGNLNQFPILIIEFYSQSFVVIHSYGIILDFFSIYPICKMIEIYEPTFAQINQYFLQNDLNTAFRVK